MKNPSETNHQNLKTARQNLLREKERAQRHWQFTFASNCQTTHFKVNPKEAWKMVFKLMEGFQNHHKISILQNFKSKAGAEARKDEEKAKI
jgi:hypothetical protein